METKKIIVVSHCILNTASKVILYNQEEIDAEENLRRTFLGKAVAEGIQIIQLPCPEFTLYGANRWGHVSNQFDNVFFRRHCEKLLAPVLDQIREYLEHPDRFVILGIVGIDGSPSCGVDYTCEGDWYGSFDQRTDLEKSLHSAKLVHKSGILIQVLKDMLQREHLDDKVKITGLYAQEPEKCMSLLNQ